MQAVTTTKAIQSLSQLKTTRLTIGQVLLIPKGGTGVLIENSKQYQVMNGDSPYIIAKKYKMNLADFLRLNNLTPRSTIFPGQVLYVKAE